MSSRYAASQVSSQPRHALLQDYSFAGVRIERWSMIVDCNLDSSIVQIWNAINKIVEIDPRGHLVRLETILARREAQEKNFLPGDVNQTGEQLGK